MLLKYTELKIVSKKSINSKGGIDINYISLNGRCDAF